MTSYEQQSLIVCEEKKKKEQQALTCDWSQVNRAIYADIF